MSLPIFPALPGLTWPVLKASEFSTIQQEAPNFMDTRIQQAQNPRWHWELTFDVLRDTTTLTEYRQLQGLILAVGGKFGDFLFTDPSDNSVGPALIGGSPNTAAELQVVNDDAGNYYSPVQRNFGGLFYEDITDLNGSIAVYANGTLATVGTGAGQYQLLGPGLTIPGYSFYGMYLKWGSAPATPVTAQFNFYFRCHFEEDTQDFEQFISTMWTIGGSESKNGSGFLKLCTSKIPQI
jgi:Conserved hypothetical protein 2217 (DUF2460)